MRALTCFAALVRDGATVFPPVPRTVPAVIVRIRQLQTP
jgi:hypothetical protein